jgi:hypothetical protein
VRRRARDRCPRSVRRLSRLGWVGLARPRVRPAARGRLQLPEASGRCLPSWCRGRRLAVVPRVRFRRPAPKPIEIRSVTAAAVARTAVLSRVGALATRWSVDQIESSPSCSASRALARTSPRIGRAESGVEVGRITPISTGMPSGNRSCPDPVPPRRRLLVAGATARALGHPAIGVDGDQAAPVEDGLDHHQGSGDAAPVSRGGSPTLVQSIPDTRGLERQCLL